LEQNQNVLIWSAYCRNKIGTFQSVPKLFKTESERFHTPRLQSKQNGTFANYFQIFLTVWNVFLCSKLLRNQNRTFLFLKNDIKTKPKRCKLRQGLKKKKKTFSCFKKIWKRTRTKAFGQKFSSTNRKRFVSFQNFVSKTNLFDLFWNKNTKTKAFDIERTLV
jgi:hypothetical protein